MLAAGDGRAQSSSTSACNSSRRRGYLPQCSPGQQGHPAPAWRRDRYEERRGGRAAQWEELRAAATWRSHQATGISSHADDGARMSDRRQGGMAAQMEDPRAGNPAIGSGANVQQDDAACTVGRDMADMSLQNRTGSSGRVRRAKRPRTPEDPADRELAPATPGLGQAESPLARPATCHACGIASTMTIGIGLQSCEPCRQAGDGKPLGSGRCCCLVHPTVRFLDVALHRT